MALPEGHRRALVGFAAKCAQNVAEPYRIPAESANFAIPQATVGMAAAPERFTKSPGMPIDGGAIQPPPIGLTPLAVLRDDKSRHVLARRGGTPDSAPCRYRFARHPQRGRDPFRLTGHRRH